MEKKWKAPILNLGSQVVDPDTVAALRNTVATDC